MTFFCSWKERKDGKKFSSIFLKKQIKIVVVVTKSIHHMDCPHPEVP
jgi:hypothetical protein